MRKSLGLALVVIGCVAAVLGILSARARSDSAAPAGSRFTVVEHNHTDASQLAKGSSLGDLVAFANPVYNAGDTAQVGRDQGSCIRTRLGVSWQCSWTTILSGGSIVVEGPYYDAAGSTLAIIGGTGTWSGARGQMLLHPRGGPGSTYDFTFEVQL
jgi:hypothetical protein